MGRLASHERDLAIHEALRRHDEGREHEQIGTEGRSAALGLQGSTSNRRGSGGRSVEPDSGRRGRGAQHREDHARGAGLHLPVEDGSGVGSSVEADTGSPQPYRLIYPNGTHYIVHTVPNDLPIGTRMSVNYEQWILDDDHEWVQI